VTHASREEQEEEEEFNMATKRLKSDKPSAALRAGSHLNYFFAKVLFQ
jgi:hypothetical protein